MFSLSVEDHHILSNKSTIWVAYSGGLDSCVLLHQMNYLFPHVKAIHVNHGLSPHAAEWESFCKSVCEQYNVPLQVCKVDVRVVNGSLENAARDARYSAFESVLQPDDVVVMAHHADDQLETFLMRAMRGSGLDGLCGIPKTRVLGAGVLYRPLLNFTRDNLMEYARAHELKWITDESNGDNTINRNFLRNEVIPLLKSRWQNVEATVSRVTSNLTDAKYLLEEHTAQSFDACKVDGCNFAINADALNEMSYSTSAHILYHWLKSLGFTSLTKKNLESVLNFELPFKNREVEIYQHGHLLYALKPIVTLSDKIKFFGDSKYQIKTRNAAQGDSNLIKSVFKAMRVPVWLRNKIPLMYDGDVFKGLPMIILPTVDNTRALKDCVIEFKGV